MEKESFIYLITTLFLVLLISFGCDSTDPKPPEKPPGYQEDIPWPSLADSPWPTYRGDAQSTGRSKYASGIGGQVNTIIDSTFSLTGFVADKNNNIYIGIADFEYPNYEDGGLYCFDESGKVNWRFLIPANNASTLPHPVISINETIYTYTNLYDHTLYSLNSDGKIEWIEEDLGITIPAIGIGKDGNIIVLVYKGSDVYQLQVYSPTGNLIWYIEDDRFGFTDGMSFSPDGKSLYIAGGDHGKGPAVIAIDLQTQNIKWTFGEKKLHVSSIPLVDSHGNIYVMSSDANNNGFLYSLDNFGVIRWQYEIYDFLENSWSLISTINLFAMDKYGNIYTGDHTLMSINYNGKLNWEIDLNSHISSPIVIDRDNFIYFSIGIDAKELVCVDSEGNVRFSISLPGIFTNSATVSPAFTKNKLIFTEHHNESIYIIK